MKLKSLLLFITLISLLAFNINAIAQSSHKSKVDTYKRDKWIKETSLILEDFNPDKAEKIVKLKTRDFESQIHQSYRIVREGYIKMDKKEWVYIILHSSHDKDGIGDVAMAINQDGITYIHHGHICGGIVHYETVASELYTKSANFFKYFVDDTEGLGWREVFAKKLD